MALCAQGLPRPAVAQASAKTLRFVPQANLANPDPVWTTATVAINHVCMVFDTLYGIDEAVDRSRRCVPARGIR
jgi:peptide/nickel transport system substrate-binding protein